MEHQKTVKALMAMGPEIAKKTRASLTGSRSEWLQAEESEVYVRFFDERRPYWGRPMYVWANININPEGSGILSQALPDLMEQCRQNDWVLCFENVLGDGLRNLLTLNGFEDFDGTADQHGSLYWFHDSLIPIENSKLKALS